MTMSIRFPHLGIVLEHVGKSVSVFGFEIAYYGITMALSMLCGLGLAMAVGKRTRQNPDDYFDLGLIAILVSLVCARIYYVVFSWDYYGAHPAEILDVRGGGLAIYGGIIGGVLTVLVFARVRKKNALCLMDTAACGLILGQIIGRWGNFFNREAFGGYTDGLLAMQLPMDAVRASEVTEEMLDHVQTINGIDYIQVHPTFLYESLWNLGVLLIMLFIICRKQKRFHGEVFFLYLLGYGLGRVWIEGLRTDQLLLPGSTVPVSQLLSALLVVAAGIALVLMSRKTAGRPLEETEDEKNDQKRSTEDQD